MRYSKFKKMVLSGMQLNLHQLAKKYPLTFKNDMDIWEEFLEYEYKIMVKCIMQNSTINPIKYMQSLINCIEIRLSDFCYNLELIEEEQKWIV